MSLRARIHRRLEREARFAMWRVRRRLDPDAVETFELDRANGVRVRYPLRSAIGLSLYLREFEVHELEFMRATLRPGHVCFDVGANGGIMTVTAAQSVGAAGQVHAFEAGARELALLRDNLRLNHIENVTVFEGAVTDHVGTVRFAVAEDGAFSALAPTDHPHQVVSGFREVRATTLDAYVEEHGIHRVHFVKVDVEGAEKLVFGGAMRLLARQRPLTILFEAFHASAAGFGYGVNELFATLRASGFTLHAFDRGGQLVTFDERDARIGRQIYNFVARA